MSSVFKLKNFKINTEPRLSFAPIINIGLDFKHQVQVTEPESEKKHLCHHWK